MSNRLVFTDGRVRLNPINALGANLKGRTRRLTIPLSKGICFKGSYPFNSAEKCRKLIEIDTEIRLQIAN